MLANEWGEQKATDYVASLMKLNPKLHRGRELRSQMVAAGEFFIGATLYDYRVRSLKAKGATITSTALAPIMAFPNVWCSRATRPTLMRLPCSSIGSFQRSGKNIRVGAGQGSDTQGSGPRDGPDGWRPADESHRTRGARTKIGYYAKLYRKITGQ